MKTWLSLCAAWPVRYQEIIKNERTNSQVYHFSAHARDEGRSLRDESMATILIVEDEQQIRELLVVLLTPEHQVLQAVDTAQAIELARLTQPDLVLLDLNLQGHQDGLEVCQTLRSEADPVLAQVPIVMLTGQTTAADISAALAVGANSYIGKPYSPRALLTLIAALLARRAV